MNRKARNSLNSGRKGEFHEINSEWPRKALLLWCEDYRNWLVFTRWPFKLKWQPTCPSLIQWPCFTPTSCHDTILRHKWDLLFSGFLTLSSIFYKIILSGYFTINVFGTVFLFLQNGHCAFIQTQVHEWVLCQGRYRSITFLNIAKFLIDPLCPSSSAPPSFLLLLLQKMSQEFEIKRLSLEEQRDRLQQQLDNLKEELSAKLNMANQEVRDVESAPLENNVTRVIARSNPLATPSRCPTSRSWWGRGSRAWVRLRPRSAVWRRLRRSSG